jgi:hypothetical protein
MIWRVAGFGVLILLIILLPVYRFFGLAYEFWIGLAVCALLIFWCYKVYGRFYAIVECPFCRFKMTFQQFKLSQKCPQCHRELHAKLEK